MCFQELLINQLKDRMRQQGRYFRIRELKQTQEKNVRIGSIHPLVTSGLLQFSRRHTTLMEQLKQFPGAAHDDGPDALEMAVRMAQRPEAMMVRAYGVP